MRILIFILSVLLAMPALGQKRRTDETAVHLFQEGITYALPRTGFRITVSATKESFTPGPYAAYAEQLLGITNVRNRASVNWSIDNVEMESFAEPDPEQVHKTMGNAASFVNLTADGLLAGVNAGQSPEGIPLLRTNSFAGGSLKHDPFSFANINDSPVFAPGDSSNNFRPYRVSMERKAAEAAERVLECRQAKYHMVAGLMDEFHPDGNAYTVSLNELEKIEEDYLSLFSGRTTYQSEVFSFDFVPVSASDRGEVVFRFSDDAGVLPASDLSGKPVTLRVETEKGLVSKYTEFARSQSPDAGESGLFYRLPITANISLVYELKTIATARTVIAQFGQVAPLPEELLTGEYTIEIHHETGAVKSIRKK